MEPSAAPNWGKVIDHTRCIGCHACTTACKSENEVPLSVTRTYVKSVEVGQFPQSRRLFQVTRCNQCDDAPCVTACPTASMFRRPDGIVDFDKTICIGCKACIAACPYDAIFINPDDHAAEKCNFCAHRIDMGLEPACVVVCPTEALIVGDLNDRGSKVAQIVYRDAVAVRRPEKETQPKVFYKGAHQATLDPLAARRPAGNLYMWSAQGHPAAQVASGHPEPPTNSAAAVVSYDVPHGAPWDWRVSLYTWTKSIAAGAYLVPLLLILGGLLTWTSPLWTWAAPAVAAGFLGVTGALLVWDLEHPERFYLIFTRPQWRSWLVRGAFVILAYALVLGLHGLGGTLDRAMLPRVLAPPGLALAILTAVYTAYLFAQAKGRDLWQSRLLPIHLFVQAVLAGSAAMALVARVMEPRMVQPLLWMTAAASFVHVVLVVAEVTPPQGTTHVRVAVREMTRGRYARAFWTGVVLVGLGGLAPWLGTWAAPVALAGLLASEHAYVQAGQAAPLA